MIRQAGNPIMACISAVILCLIPSCGWNLPATAQPDVPLGVPLVFTERCGMEPLDNGLDKMAFHAAYKLHPDKSSNWSDGRRGVRPGDSLRLVSMRRVFLDAAGPRNGVYGIVESGEFSGAKFFYAFREDYQPWSANTVRKK